MAISLIPDLTHSYKDQEYTFVGQLEDYLREIECPICRRIVNKPLLTNCGHLFCEECHKKLRRNAECPVCKKKHTTMEDKNTDRRVKNLKVRCINHTKGCDWVGCMSDEGQHRAKQSGCGYEDIQCIHGCGDTIRRMMQQVHSVECPMRLHKCAYCGDEGRYWEMVNDHLETCSRYPVQCPNGCMVLIPREDTESYKLMKYIEQLSSEIKAQAKQIQDLEQEAKDKKTPILEWDYEDFEWHNEDKQKAIIKRLKRNAKAQERKARDQAQRILDLEWDVEAKKQQVIDLEKNIDDTTQLMQALVGEVIDKRQRTEHLEREVAGKTRRIEDLEREVACKRQRTEALEREVAGKTRRIEDLEREVACKRQRTEALEREVKTKAERIHELERGSKFNVMDAFEVKIRKI